MSIRGPSRTRGLGRLRGRGRGRGRGGRTQIWEWENYKPGPEIYASLWHIRKAPPSITPNLPNDCPLAERTPGASSRILDRKQDDDAIRRYYYEVLVRTPVPRQTLDEEIARAGGIKLEDAWREEIIDVDISRILEYVSARELERYENDDMQQAADAEAAARQAELEERKQRHIMKNAGMRGSGRGKRMLNGLGLDHGSGSRGRPRGRGKRAGMRDARTASNRLIEKRDDVDILAASKPEDVDESALDAEDELAMSSRESPDRVIAETEDELDEEEEDILTTSPIMLSSFVANSALPRSPIVVHRGQIRIPDIDDSEEEGDSGRVSLSSAAAQLMLEKDQHQLTSPDLFDDEEQGHRMVKKRRTESNSSSRFASHVSESLPPPSLAHPTVPRETLNESENESSDDAIPARVSDDDSMDLVPTTFQTDEEQVDDSDAEEFTVEAIQAHMYQDGVKYYLVKWEGYGDATDWLPEDDMEGAAEMVAAYNAAVKRKKGKRRVK